MDEKSDDLYYPSEYLYSKKEKKLILDAMTNCNSSDQDALKMINVMKTKIGCESETGLGRGNLGYKKEIRYFLQELPWNAERILKQCNDSFQ